ncbi:hypothetical protein J2S92_003590 [Arthrobacter bambusae]|nr:hypothetical protein [Arthrobacter bambusae]MDQ0237197.1 hypothetical protein [Arthrobacter bambusae]
MELIRGNLAIRALLCGGPGDTGGDDSGGSEGDGDHP